MVVRADRPHPLSRALLLLALVAIAGCAKPPSASPADPATSSGGSASPVAAASSPGTEVGGPPELVVYATGERTLRGFLARPAGMGPFPAIVFNHGSEKLPGAKDGQIAFYTSHGFALFVPHRRGHGRSDGTYLMEEVEAAPLERRGGLLVEKLVEQVDDVAAAVAYVKRQSFVDPARVAVVGCSLGGIESLLAAERDLGIRAAVDFAGGAMAWAQQENQPLRDCMSEAARHARVPVFLLQAENDFDTRPTRVLAAEMEKAGRSHRDKIFPPNGTTHEEGHAFCAGGTSPPWAADVLEFLAGAMANPRR
jgi:dienelactone hydrolase